MSKYNLRIITVSCAQMSENNQKLFLHSLPGTSELHIEPLKPYWKNPEQGELLCSFTSAQPIEEIRTVLADHWEGDVADARWSHIHIPHAVFIWLNT